MEKEGKNKVTPKDPEWSTSTGYMEELTEDLMNLDWITPFGHAFQIRALNYIHFTSDTIDPQEKAYSITSLPDLQEFLRSQR